VIWRETTRRWCCVAAHADLRAGARTAVGEHELDVEARAGVARDLLQHAPWKRPTRPVVGGIEAHDEPPAAAAPERVERGHLLDRILGLRRRLWPDRPHAASRVDPEHERGFGAR
jgi:hypothetical protein